MKNKHIVFCYGSLKKGYHNHSILHSAEFIGESRTTERYDMFSFGSFPAVNKYPQQYHVTGELYLVDDSTLAQLDILEGNGYFYQRVPTNIDGYEEKAWVYFHIGADDEDSTEGISITGDVATWK